MADRPNFKKAPAADGKKQHFAGRIFSRIKEKMAGTQKKALVAAEYMDLKMNWQSYIRGRSRAPFRKNGEKEMLRRRTQMANGTHGL